MNKFYLVYPFGSVDDFMFKDVDNMVHVDAKSKVPKNGLSKICKKIHLSRKINSVIHLPNKSFWYDFKDIGKNKEDQYHCFVLGSSFLHMPFDLFKRIFVKPNVHIYLVMLDPINSNTPVPAMTRNAIKKFKFEKMFTHDLVESQKHGFIYMDEHLFSNDLERDKGSKEEFDLYFLGRFKNGRSNNVFDLVRAMDKHGVKFHCAMQVTSFGVKDAGITKLECEDKIDYFTDFITYEDVIKETDKARCVLELVQGTESDTTLRYFEAVTLGKKLLTNNKNIVNMRYYNPKYMKIFTDINDIDFEWLKKKEKVDYGYKGDFSSKIFFDQQIALIDKP